MNRISTAVTPSSGSSQLKRSEPSRAVIVYQSLKIGSWSSCTITVPLTGLEPAVLLRRTLAGPTSI